MDKNLLNSKGDVEIARYSELKHLCWFRPGAKTATPEDAFGLYTKLWAYVDREKLTEEEVSLLTYLAKKVGGGCFYPEGGRPIELEGIYCD